MGKTNKKSRITPSKRTIILDISEKEYAKVLIDEWISKDKEQKLFPKAIFEGGYTLKGKERLPAFKYFFIIVNFSNMC